MMSKVTVIILILICLGLGVALVTQHRKQAQEKQDLNEQLALKGENLQKTATRLEEQTQFNIRLENDLLTRSNELALLSSNLSKVSLDLEKTDAQAKATAEQLRLAQAEMVKKDQKIGELEGERVELGKQMDQLTNSITALEQQIASTEKKLLTAQGEKNFLVKELARMRAEKAELERQFNDLAVLRAQVSRLKEEMAIARRLEFIRLNLFGGVTAKGGATKLMPAPRPPLPAATNYDLNVEIRQGSGAQVLVPTGSNAASNVVRTNAAQAPAFPIK